MKAVPADMVEAEADKCWQRWSAGPQNEKGEKVLACAVAFYKDAIKRYQRDEQHQQVLATDQCLAVQEKLITALLEFNSKYEAIKTFEAMIDCLLQRLLETDVDRYEQLFIRSSALYVEEKVEDLFITKVRNTAEHFAVSGKAKAAIRLFKLIHTLLPGGKRETSRPEAMITFISLLAEQADYRGAHRVIREEIRLPANRPRLMRFFIDTLMITVALEDSHGAERIFKDACLA
jgi:hypothetical protein